MRKIIISILFYLSGQFVHANQLNITDSIEIYTLSNKIRDIKFKTLDTTLNCFIIIDTLGRFDFFTNKNDLNNYIDFHTSSSLFFSEDSIFGTGTYQEKFIHVYPTDTVYQFITQNWKNGITIDSLKKASTLYDIENSYILNSIQQTFNEKYIYLLTNYGTHKFFAYPSYIRRKSSLIKIDTTQDSVSNLFIYTTRSSNYAGMQLVWSDSVTIPLKKMKKIKKYNNLLLRDQQENQLSIGNTMIKQTIFSGRHHFIISREPYLDTDKYWVYYASMVNLFVKRILPKKWKQYLP